MDYNHFFYAVTQLTNVKVKLETHKKSTAFIENIIRMSDDETIEDQISVILEKYAPNITYLHFRKLIKLVSTHQQSYHYDYYDEDSKTETIQNIKVKDLYDALVSLGYISIDCDIVSKEENFVKFFMDNMRKIKINGISFNEKDNVFEIDHEKITKFPDEFFDLFSLNKLSSHTRKNLVYSLVNQINDICYYSYYNDMSMDVCDFYLLVDNIFNIKKKVK